MITTTPIDSVRPAHAAGDESLDDIRLHDHDPTNEIEPSPPNPKPDRASIGNIEAPPTDSEGYVTSSTTSESDRTSISNFEAEACLTTPPTTPESINIVAPMATPESISDDELHPPYTPDNPNPDEYLFRPQPQDSSTSQLLSAASELLSQGLSSDESLEQDLSPGPSMSSRTKNQRWNFRRRW